MASCPQVTFAYPGGVVQSAALLTRPSPAALRARLSRAGGGVARAVEALRERRVPRAPSRLPAGSSRCVGWCAREVEEELPELRLLVVEAQIARQAPGHRRLAAGGPGAPARTVQPVSRRPRGELSAANPFPRPTGCSFVTSASTRTSCARRSRRRCSSGCFAAASSRAACCGTSLLIALVDTGVPVWALDAESVDGPLGIRASREGERLGRSPMPRSSRSAGWSSPTPPRRWRSCSARSAPSTCPATARGG